jgi:hypothetical protein
MDPEEISKKANKERVKKQAQIKVVAKEKIYPTYHAYSFHTYSKIFPSSFVFVGWMFLGLAGTALMVVYYLEGDMGVWSIYAGLTCIGIFLLRWFIEFLRKLFTYNSYKTFSSSLGFQLEGWDQLGSYPKQLIRGQWSKNSTVEITLKEYAPDEQIKLVKDALYLFVAKANDQFYEAEIGGDGRNEWKFVNDFKVSGSSDVGVIGQLFTLLHVYLKSIQDKYPVIVAVKVKFDPEIFQVKPPPNTD